MSNSPSILIEELKIVGIEKNYIIPFFPGVNVIWGDIDCGKSTILSLINYTLGSSTFIVHDELEAKARTCQLKLLINNKRYVFERDIFDKKQYIRCYKNRLSRDVAPSILSPVLSDDTAPDGYISFFILDLLGLPITKVKLSPSRLDSTLNRVGFKDLLKFIFLKQKDIASDSMLSMGDGARYVKNKEILKFLLNIHNEDISQIQSSIAENKKYEKEKEQEEKGILKFLEKMDFGVNFNVDDEIEKNKKIISDIDDVINDMKLNYKKTIGYTREIEKSITNANNMINEANEKINIYTSDLDKYIKLKYTYIEELDSISLSIKVESKLSSLECNEKVISCPLCTSKITKIGESQTIPVSVLKNEKLAINRKVTSLNSMIDKTRTEIDFFENQKKIACEFIEESQLNFNQKYASEVSELVESISFLEKQKVEIISQDKVLKRDKKIGDRLSFIKDELSNFSKSINRLELDLKKAQDKSESPDLVIERLNKLFVDMIDASGLSHMKTSGVNDRLDYVIRNRSYLEHTSGGVRTVSSILIYLSKLRYALEFDSNLPTFLMLDTPGNNMGKHRTDAEKNNGDSDLNIYNNIYSQLEMIATYANENNKDFQVIVVDNDLSTVVKDNDLFHVVKRFSKSDPECDSGLINDYIH